MFTEMTYTNLSLVAAGPRHYDTLPQIQVFSKMSEYPQKLINCALVDKCIDRNLNDNIDCTHKKSIFIGQVNKLCAKFGYLKMSLLVRLFKTYCCTFYGSQIWQVNSQHIKADQLDSLKKFCILSENVIFHD